MVDYEYMRNTQRKERSSSKIVDVGESYYPSLAGFIKNATQSYDASKDASDFRSLENVSKVAKDIFDKREQKILLKALIAARTGEDDNSGMTNEEKAVYTLLVGMLREHRKFFEKVLVGEYAPTARPAEEDKLIKEKENNIVLVRVVKEIPRFVGADSSEYGPFEANQVVKLPAKEAELLSQQSLVEKL